MSPTSTIPERKALGASTTNRKYYIDVVDPDATGPTDLWVGVFGVQEAKPRHSEAVTQDDSDFDGEGWKSQALTAMTWGIDGKLLRKLDGDDSTAYDPGQEIIRKVAARIGGRLKARFYEMEPDGPRIEAMTGWVTPTWAADGGNMESLDSVAFTLTGNGKPLSFEHPEAAPAAPVISSILPPNAETGAQVVISGAYFDLAGATGYVKFGADPVPESDVTIVSASQILAKVPAGDEGPVVVSVGTTQAIYQRGGAGGGG